MPVTASTAPGSRPANHAVAGDDAAFLDRFERCTLAEAEWTHLAHVRVAWTWLSIAPPSEALERIRRGILRYNTEVLGRRHKYHDTVTVAFAYLIHNRMRDGESWAGFASRIDDLLDADSPILLQYYSSARLFSDAARQHFVLPDLLELPVPG